MTAALPIERLEHMTPAEEQRFWKLFERTLARDDGQAAKSHLAAGRPIYYCDDRYPNDLVREWPDGSRELVAIDSSTGGFTIVRTL